MHAARRLLFALGLSVLLPFAVPAQAPGKDVVIMLDVSGSMRKGGLFDFVKHEISSLVESFSLGDRIIVYSFADDVALLEDRVLEKATDLGAIDGRLSATAANGRYTYLTKAVETAFERIEQSQSRDPRRRTEVWILTDGKNEPPPAAGQGALTFEKLVSLYKGKIDQRKTAFNLVTFGEHQASADSTALAQIGVNSRQTTRELKPVFGSITLTPSEQELFLATAGKADTLSIVLQVVRAGRKDPTALSFAIPDLPSWAKPVSNWRTLVSSDTTSVRLSLAVQPPPTLTSTAHLELRPISDDAGWTYNPTAVSVLVTPRPPLKVRWTPPASWVMTQSGNSATRSDTVKIDNPGTQPLVLRLSAVGENAPLFKISPDSLTVPPGAFEAPVDVSFKVMPGVTSVGLRLLGPVGTIAEPDTGVRVALSLVPLHTHPPYGLYTAIALLVLFAVLVLYFRSRPKFETDVTLDRLNENGETVETIALSGLQGVMRGPIVLSRDAALPSVVNDGVQIYPGLGTVRLVALAAEIKRSAADDAEKELVLSDDETFLIQGERYRIHVPMPSIDLPMDSTSTDASPAGA